LPTGHHAPVDFCSELISGLRRGQAAKGIQKTLAKRPRIL